MKYLQSGHYQAHWDGVLVEVIRGKEVDGSKVWTAWVGGECVGVEPTKAAAVAQVTLSAEAQGLYPTTEGPRK